MNAGPRGSLDYFKKNGPSVLTPTASLLPMLAAIPRRTFRKDPWGARNLMCAFEVIAEMECADPRSYSRIWYVSLYSNFYTRIGETLLALGDVDGALECLDRSYNCSLESPNEAAATMWAARGYPDLSSEALQDEVFIPAYPTSLAHSLAIAGHVDRAVGYLRLLIQTDRRRGNRGRYCYALARCLSATGKKRDAVRFVRLLGTCGLMWQRLCQVVQRP